MIRFKVSKINSKDLHLFFKNCVKTLRHGPANRVGGTQNRAKSFRPFRGPSRLPALAASILYSGSFSDRRAFQAFFWKAMTAPFELMNFSASFKTLVLSPDVWKFLKQTRQ